MQKDDGTSVGIVAARRDVELARADLRDSVRAASEAGARLGRRVADSAKPVLAVLVGVGLLALAAGLYRLTRGRRLANGWRGPARRSLLSEMLRAALVSASARLASAAVLRIQVRQLEAMNPATTEPPH